MGKLCKLCDMLKKRIFSNEKRLMPRNQWKKPKERCQDEKKVEKEEEEERRNSGKEGRKK
jgi:hypothetical protein